MADLLEGWVRCDLTDPTKAARLLGWGPWLSQSIVVDLRETLDWAKNHRGTDHGALGARFNEEGVGRNLQCGNKKPPRRAACLVRRRARAFAAFFRAAARPTSSCPA